MNAGTSRSAILIGRTLLLVAVLAVGCAGGARGVEEPAAGEPSVLLPTASGPVSAYEDGSVLRFLASDGRFGILVGIIEEYEPGLFLPEFSRSSWPHTFFASTDVAFEGLSPATVGQLLQDADLLTRVLRYHVVPGSPRSSTDLAPGSLGTLSGPVDVAQGRERTVVGGVPVVEANLAVAGGLIHVIDRLIVPCADPLVRDRGLACPAYPDGER
jgi:hypothetical protein